MKLYISRVLVLLAFTILALPCCSVAPKMVLLIGRETSEDMSMMIEKEVTPIITALRDAGYKVDIATQSGKNIVVGSVVLEVQKRLADVDIKQYRAVIVPCMAAGGTAQETPEEAVAVLKDAVAKKIPLAAQQSGVLLLGRAGALAGIRYATAEENSYLISDGTYSGVGVVQDGNVITSGTCPYMAKYYSGMKDGTIELVTKFISMLK